MPVYGSNRDHPTLFPTKLDDLIGDDYPVGLIDAFAVSLGLATLGFACVEVTASGR